MVGQPSSGTNSKSFLKSFNYSPMITTRTFIAKLADFSEIGFFNDGLMRSSNITPAIEFNPVDIELQTKTSNINKILPK